MHSPRVLSLLSLLCCAAACTAQSDAPSDGDESIGDLDTNSQAVSVTSTPGKAVWVKLYRRSDQNELGSTVRATAVASDESGAAFVTRREWQYSGLQVLRRDLTRYDGYGNLQWRRTIGGDPIAVAAHAGIAAVAEAVGERGRLEVRDAGSGSERWARDFQAQDVRVTTVAVDNSGNVIAAGNVSGDADFGGGPLVAPGGNTDRANAFVVKYSSTGEYVFGRRFGSDGFSGVRSVTTDGAGGVYLAGAFRGWMNLGDNRVLTDPDTSNPMFDGFVVRLSSSGNIELVKQIDGTSMQDVTHIALDDERNIFLAGMFSKTINFGGGSLNSDDDGTASSSAEPFLAKLSPNGAHMWSRAYQGKWSRTITGLAVDSYGQATISMNFDSSVKVGSTTYVAESHTHALVTKYSSGGTVRWTKEYGTADGNVTAYGLAATPSARLLLVGTFFGKVNFGGSTFESSHPKGENALGPTDGFFARLYQ